MTNYDVCVAFVNGSNNGCHSLNMRVNHDGSRLFSYGTCIAEKLSNGSIIINETKYSITTSKHQSHLRWAISANAKGITIHHTNKHVPRETYNLTHFYSK